MKLVWNNRRAANASHILQSLSSRSNSADTMRDIFRTLAAGAEVVETERLRVVMKLVWNNRLSEEKIDLIFAQHLPRSFVHLSEFLTIRDALLQREHDVYLP